MWDVECGLCVGRMIAMRVVVRSISDFARTFIKLSFNF